GARAPPCRRNLADTGDHRRPQPARVLCTGRLPPVPRENGRGLRDRGRPSRLRRGDERASTPVRQLPSNPLLNRGLLPPRGPLDPFTSSPRPRPVLKNKMVGPSTPFILSLSTLSLSKDDRRSGQAYTRR